MLRQQATQQKRRGQVLLRLGIFLAQAGLLRWRDFSKTWGLLLLLGADRERRTSLLRRCRALTWPGLLSRKDFSARKRHLCSVSFRNWKNLTWSVFQKWNCKKRWNRRKKIVWHWKHQSGDVLERRMLQQEMNLEILLLISFLRINICLTIC